jgi:hypothetical protein
VALCAAGSLFAQQKPIPRYRSEVHLNRLIFGNFFQAAEGHPEETVTAVTTSYRGIYRPTPKPLDVYAQVEYMNFTGIDRDSAYGGRVGVTYDGRIHDFEGFIDRGENRVAFDVGNRTAFANITTVSGEYSYRVAEDWQLGAEGYHERQRFDVRSDRENDYSSLGASVRYRGFGSNFSPRIGYVVGKRDVVNDTDSYDDRYWYIQATSAPHPKVYISVRYRGRKREYDAIAPSTTARVDDRSQWTAFVGYRIAPHYGTALYYSREGSNSNFEGDNFKTSFLLLGVTLYF